MMGAMKQYQIDVQQAVSQEVADVFTKAARMDSTERMLSMWFSDRGWFFWSGTSMWYAEPVNDDGHHKNAQAFPTWEQCLAFLLEQIKGFALVDEAGQIIGYGGGQE